MGTHFADGLQLLSFSSGALGDWEHRVEDYLAALTKELEAIAKMSEGRKADTIYMGGGTPTTLNADQLDRLLTCIDRHFVREGLLEFTVEAGRPGQYYERETSGASKSRY